MRALADVWVVLLGVVWTLYLVLGGADLGVGTLLRRLAPADRDAALRAIGPTWAANDVWLVIAVAATFGAFPGWYGAWASHLYLPLLLLLLAIIVRHAGIELRSHHGDAGQERWTLAIGLSSALVAVGWGVVWASALDGTQAAGDAAGLGIVTAHGVVAGLAFLALCRVQGAAFLAWRLREERPELAAAARASVRRAAPVAAVLTTGAGAWTALSVAPGTSPGVVGWGCAALGALALLAVLLGAAGGRARWTLGAGALAVAAAFGALYAALTPLGIAGPGGIALAPEASGDLTLGWMLAVTVVVLPGLLAVQGWTYVRFLRAPRRDAARGGGVVRRAAHAALEGLR